MFHWLVSRTKRRSEPLPRPFPPAWRALLARLPLVARLPLDEDRAQLERDVYWFITEKTWTPFDIAIDDAKQVAIAAFACLLINRRLDLGVFPRTREIILRRSPFGERVRSVAPDGSIFESRSDLLGQAWYRGPIVLAWSSVAPLTRWADSPHNVVIHEFAHALDHLDGYTDGTPPLETRRAIEQWAALFQREFDRLRATLAAGEDPVIDPYGASNPAEFFAVVTEQFFCRPALLRGHHPRLYDEMREFFGHDPATWPSA